MSLIKQMMQRFAETMKQVTDNWMKKNAVQCSDVPACGRGEVQEDICGVGAVASWPTESELPVIESYVASPPRYADGRRAFRGIEVTRWYAGVVSGWPVVGKPWADGETFGTDGCLYKIKDLWCSEEGARQHCEANPPFVLHTHPWHLQELPTPVGP